MKRQINKNSTEIKKTNNGYEVIERVPVIGTLVTIFDTKNEAKEYINNLSKPKQ